TLVERLIGVSGQVQAARMPAELDRQAEAVRRQVLGLIYDDVVEPRRVSTALDEAISGPPNVLPRPVGRSYLLQELHVHQPDCLALVFGQACLPSPTLRLEVLLAVLQALALDDLEDLVDQVLVGETRYDGWVAGDLSCSPEEPMSAGLRFPEDLAYGFASLDDLDGDGVQSTHLHERRNRTEKLLEEVTVRLSQCVRVRQEKN